MKKQIFLFSCLLTCCLCLQAQDPTDNYGNITAEEKQLKACAFDKDAEAVILMDEALSNYNDEYNLVTVRHIRIKILKEKGIDAANISIPFYSKDNFETITNVSGDTYNDKGNGEYTNIPVEKKSIYTQKTNERYGEVRFTFPSVKAGSIIEYTYRSIMKHFGGLRDWYFQKELPVLSSKYKLYILPNAEFAYRVYKSPELAITVTPDKEGGAISFEMKNIAGLREEAYMDSRNDYLQRVTFQLSAYNNGSGKNKYMASWNDVARELRDENSFGNQLGKTIPGTDEFIKSTKLISSAQERMKKVYDYVRTNMNWNGYYSKYAGDGVKEAWTRKSGTSGEINLALNNLLKAAGLDALPVLVSERFNGKVYTDYPFIDQFNSVFACVKIDATTYYLDATDKFTPAHITPYDILNTTAVIINRKTGDIVNITNDSLQYKETNLIIAEVSADGIAKGNIYTTSMDYARIKKKQEYESNKPGFLEKHFSKLHEGIAISGFETENDSKDSLAFIQKCGFTLPLPGTGEYSFIPLNMGSGFENNPFVSDNRFSNINFGYRQTINLTTQVHLPDNYAVNELPKPIKLTNPGGDIVFTRRIFYDQEQKKIAATLSLEIKKSLYPADVLLRITRYTQYLTRTALFAYESRLVLINTTKPTTLK